MTGSGFNPANDSCAVKEVNIEWNLRSRSSLGLGCLFVAVVIFEVVWLVFCSFLVFLFLNKGVNEFIRMFPGNV